MHDYVSITAVFHGGFLSLHSIVVDQALFTALIHSFDKHPTNMRELIWL